ncbi:ABC transporter substrate-binding protein [Maritimibacter sp. DP07]|jgi:TRAP-type C4-dicarboxylate transport system substrate-binding protein|uniref:ABC transporter substrate-binding protein n=1 Tax=Maritimibacter harenae TaxID=2606218 RepID=A0A845M378_9RHOB|nr:TRAP transporter substrate-binding protein DctP [Maritimibacter harenae]MZR14495.1 ABC transporter substrate-binding protein [Maritimibacter harenae]
MKKTIVAALAASTLATGAQAQEVQLQAASCFPQGTFFSQRFEKMIEEVNEKGEGLVSINYVGGAPAIGSQLTVVQKVAQGIYDLNSCTGSYYQNVVPEADAWKLLEKTPAEIRENGGWDYMNEIHNEKNLEVLSRHHYGTKFHLFLAEDSAIDSPDLSGLHLRTAPTYTNFFKSLGATTQDTNVQQIFTLMENGTVKGYGWPVLGHQPGWETVTKYRVDPGFYDVDLMIMANKRVWDGLPEEVQTLIEDAALALEEDAVANDAALNEQVAAKQVENGFEVIEFTGEEREQWLNAARNAGWEGVNNIAPETGPKLREYFAND